MMNLQRLANQDTYAENEISTEGLKINGEIHAEVQRLLMACEPSSVTQVALEGSLEVVAGAWRNNKDLEIKRVLFKTITVHEEAINNRKKSASSLGSIDELKLLAAYEAEKDLFLSTVFLMMNLNLVEKFPEVNKAICQRTARCLDFT